MSRSSTSAKKSTVSKYLGLIILGMMIFALSFYYPGGKNHTIVLDNNGFSPATLNIKKGDTVTFTTTLKKPFWPASNLHPTHKIYSEFDPKKAILPGKSWSFTFNREGEWRFHDHLNSLYEGVITVGSKRSADQGADVASCESVPSREKLKCWEDLMGKIVRDQGIDVAFNVVDQLYKTEPLFATNCHNYVHILGKEAFKSSSNDEKIKLSAKSSYCGYGFYHGFMELLLTSGGDINQARALCEQAQVELASETSDAGGACYHGIGHGLGDQHDDRYRGNPQAMADPGLEVCEKVSDTQAKLYRCTTGVYNAIEILMTSKQYDLSIDPADPFAFCKQQKKEYQASCYPNFVPAVMNVTEEDYEAGLHTIEGIEEDEYAVSSLNALTAELARTDGAEAAALEKYVSVCRSTQPRLQNVCISSLAEGLMKYGPPQSEYKEAVSFCSSGALNEGEKNVCFERILSLLRIWYSVDTSRMICNTVEPRFRVYCRI